MPPRFVAAVTCPSCGTRFQTQIEQILDVRVDPSARNRMLSGAVNVAACPACGTAGSLNIPFVYHDPEKKAALLYLPAEAGSNEMERQQAAGRLTRQLMDSMPKEERKGYLLQPETFITMDSMVKRVLELEGVSEEEIAQSQEHQALFAQFLRAEEDEWPQLLADNEERITEGFFSLLDYMLRVSSQQGVNQAEAEKVNDLYEFLVEETELGQQLQSRTKVVRMFADNPSRDTLLEAMVNAPDEDTVRVLIQSGISFIDYAFFQKLLQMIEETDDPEKVETLRWLRRRILDLRDEMVQQSEAVMRQRSVLLGKLMGSEDPKKMASSYLSELDDIFFMVLSSQIEEAEQEGNDERLEELRHVAGVVNEVMEGNLPPEVALIRRLMVAPSDDELREQLTSNQEALTPRFFLYLQVIESSAREEGQAESAERIAEIRAIAKTVAPEAAAQAESIQAEAEQPVGVQQPGGEPEPSRKRPSRGPVLLERQAEEGEGDESSSSERRTPSGLIIPG